MDSAEPAKKLGWQQVLAALLLAGGLALVAWSFIWSNISTRSAAWSQEQAREYQATSIKLHGLSHQFAHEAQRGNEASVRAELDAAQAEYDVLRGQLESAMAWPSRIALAVRIGGLLLIVTGGDHHQ